MIDCKLDYIAAGGNRHPSAADWDAESGLLAYGADRNVALWSPLVLHLLISHASPTDPVDRLRRSKVSKDY